MNKLDVKNTIHNSVKVIETILACMVIASVFLYVVHSIGMFISADWQNKDTFYELIYRVLLATIGLELARMLVTHSFISILELLAFVVARKMLKPDITSVDIMLGVIAFAILLFANRYLITKSSNIKALSGNNQ